MQAFRFPRRGTAGIPESQQIRAALPVSARYSARGTDCLPIPNALMLPVTEMLGLCDKVSSQLLNCTVLHTCAALHCPTSVPLSPECPTVPRVSLCTVSDGPFEYAAELGAMSTTSWSLTAGCAPGDIDKRTQRFDAVPLSAQQTYLPSCPVEYELMSDDHQVHRNQLLKLP